MDVRLGVANGVLSLTPGTIPNTPSSPPRPPNTGSNIWILAVLAGLLPMAGVGLQVFRARPVRAEGAVKAAAGSALNNRIAFGYDVFMALLMDAWGMVDAPDVATRRRGR